MKSEAVSNSATKKIPYQLKSDEQGHVLNYTVASAHNLVADKRKEPCYGCCT
jgi:hypothetical protein